MYSATALINGIYSAVDLPDEIVVSDGVRSWTAQRQGTNFVGEDAFDSGQDIVTGLFEGEWKQWVEAGSGPEFIIGDYSDECLISDPNDGTPVVVTDPFLDSYTVTVSENASFYFNGTAQRISLCEWIKEFDPNFQESGVRIFYWDGISPPPDVEGTPQHGWHVITGIPPAARKSGLQNSPVGTYNFQAGFSVTIS
jgi:hypothetical protein